MTHLFHFGILGAALLLVSLVGAAEESSTPQIEQLSENKFRLGGITFFKDTRKIAFDASVNQDQDAIEYAIVHVTGKDHESLLNTEISPYHLQIVLLLCGYEPGHGDLFASADTAPKPERPSSSRDIVATVQWKSSNGALESTRIEDWILDLSTGKSMPRTTWAFTGSAVVDRSFEAEVEGSILAIYLDELALVNYPGPGNRNDEIWIPHADKMPPMNHPVRVILEPPPPAKSE